jgi:hypothetical protein
VLYPKPTSPRPRVQYPSSSTTSTSTVSCEPPPLRRHSLLVAYLLQCQRSQTLTTYSSRFWLAINVVTSSPEKTKKHLSHHKDCSSTSGRILKQSHSKNNIMGSIQTITSSSLSLSTEQNFDSKRKPHHLKTLDIGLAGNTVSANPLGDVCPHLWCSNTLYEFITKYS